MRGKRANSETVIAKIAARQHGVIAARQLRDDRSAVVAALRALLGQRSLTPNL
jgi:hypothetical protein